MVDRDRYRKRADDLTKCAQLVKDLTRMPDRATEKDFRQTADLMTDAAKDIEALIKAKPAGCICRHIEDDNYSYVDYAEGCYHHRALYHHCAAIKADYAKMEKALKAEVRMRLVTAVLTGTAEGEISDQMVTSLVRGAIGIADEVMEQLVAETKK